MRQKDGHVPGMVLLRHARAINHLLEKCQCSISIIAAPRRARQAQSMINDISARHIAPRGGKGVDIIVPITENAHIESNIESISSLMRGRNRRNPLSETNIKARRSDKCGSRHHR